MSPAIGYRNEEGTCTAPSKLSFHIQSYTYISRWQVQTMRQYASKSGCTSPNIDVKWRVCQIPSSPVSKSETNPPCISVAQPSNGSHGTRNVDRCGCGVRGVRSQASADTDCRTAQRGEPHMVRFPTGGNLLHKISIVTPKTNGRVKWPYFMLFFYLLGSCNRLTQSIQNSGSLWVNGESLRKQQWLERNKRYLIHPWRQTATVEIPLPFIMCELWGCHLLAMPGLEKVWNMQATISGSTYFTKEKHGKQSII